MPTGGATTRPPTSRPRSCTPTATRPPRPRWPDARGSVYFTARAGWSSLRDADNARWLTPQPGLPQFFPERVVAVSGTLYLLSKNVAGGTSAAALVSALTTEVR